MFRSTSGRLLVRLRRGGLNSRSRNGDAANVNFSRRYLQSKVGPAVLRVHEDSIRDVERRSLPLVGSLDGCEAGAGAQRRSPCQVGRRGFVTLVRLSFQSVVLKSDEGRDGNPILNLDPDSLQLVPFEVRMNGEVDVAKGLVGRF